MTNPPSPQSEKRRLVCESCGESQQVYDDGPIPKKWLCAACGSMKSLSHPDTLREPTLAPDGTPMAVFQKERTDAISEMFENKYADGIYPTSRFFARLDACVASLINQEKERWESEQYALLGLAKRDVDLAFSRVKTMLLSSRLLKEEDVTLNHLFEDIVKLRMTIESLGNQRKE